MNARDWREYRDCACPECGRLGCGLDCESATGTAADAQEESDECPTY